MSTETTATPRVVEIPQLDDEPVVIAVTDLPADWREIIEILQFTKAPSSTYFQVADEYRRLGNMTNWEWLSRSGFDVAGVDATDASSFLEYLKSIISITLYDLFNMSISLRNDLKRFDIPLEEKSLGLGRPDILERKIQKITAMLRYIREKMNMIPNTPQKSALQSLLLLFEAFSELFEYNSKKLAAAVSMSNADSSNAQLMASIKKVETAVRNESDPERSICRLPLLMLNGVVNWHLERYSTSRQCFADVIRLNPNSGPIPRYGLGLCLLKLGHFDASYQALMTALHADKNFRPAMTALAYLFTNASALARKRLLAEPAFLSFESNVGRARELARTLAERAVAVQTDDAQANVELAVLKQSEWTTLSAGGTNIRCAVVPGFRGLILPAGVSVSPPLYGSQVVRLVATDDTGKDTVVGQLRLLPQDFVNVVPRNSLDFSISDPALDKATELTVLRTRWSWDRSPLHSLSIQFSDSFAAISHALVAIAGTADVSGRAEAHMQLARARHASASYATALKNYRKSLDLRPDYVPALVGLLQTESYLLASNRHPGVRPAGSAAGTSAGTELVDADAKRASLLAELRELSTRQPEDRSISLALAGVLESWRALPVSLPSVPSSGDKEKDRHDRDAAFELAVTRKRAESQELFQEALKQSVYFTKAGADDPLVGLFQLEMLQRAVTSQTGVLSSGGGSAVTRRALTVALRTRQRFIDAAVPVPLALHNNIAVLSAKLAVAEANPAPEGSPSLREQAMHAYAHAILAAARESPSAIGSSNFTAEATEAQLQEALTIGSDAWTAALRAGKGVPIAFNVALLHETLGGPEGPAIAEQGYRSIIAAVPLYLDAHTRLSKLFLRREDFSGADGVLEQALATVESSGFSPTARLHPFNSALVSLLVQRAQLLEMQGLRARARESYSRALALPGFSWDHFVVLSRSNSSFSEIYSRSLSAAFLSRDKDKDKDRETDKADRAALQAEVQKILKKVFDLNKQILKYNPESIKAANGLGVVVAEQGNRLPVARRVFELLHSYDPADNIVRLNLVLALLQLASSNAAANGGAAGLKDDLGLAASKHLVSLLRALQAKDDDQVTLRDVPASGLPFSATNRLAALAAGYSPKTLYAVQLRNLLAFAYMSSKRPDFRAASETLEEALRLLPIDPRLRFNLAFIRTEWAVSVANTFFEEHSRRVEAALDNNNSNDGKRNEQSRNLDRIAATVGVKDIQDALSTIVDARQAFAALQEYVSTSTEESHIFKASDFAFSSNQLAAFIAKLADIEISMHKYLEVAKAEEEQVRAAEETRKRLIKEEQDRLRALREEEEQKNLAKIAEMDKLAAELREQMAEKLKSMPPVFTEKATKGSIERKTKKKVDDDQPAQSSMYEPESDSDSDSSSSSSSSSDSDSDSDSSGSESSAASSSDEDDKGGAESDDEKKPKNTKAAAEPASSAPKNKYVVASEPSSTQAKKLLKKAKEIDSLFDSDSDEDNAEASVPVPASVPKKQSRVIDSDDEDESEPKRPKVD